MKRLSVLTLCGLIVTPSMANIASSAYVDGIKGALEKSIEGKLSNTFEEKNSALTTGNDGVVSPGQIATGMIAGGSVTNEKLAGGIGINKLDLPTNKCSSGSCMLIYNAGTKTYTWENVYRANGETAPTTNGVDGNGNNE